jgi:anaerobic magnesium-protoporphyrin IX monomethyl ester cyclase
MTPDYLECVELAKKIKRQNPSGIFVIGGIHVTVFRDAHKVFDHVCIGEGELAFESLLNCRGSKTRILKSESFMQMDALPIPERNLMPYDSIVTEGLIEGEKATGVLFSRGCPYRCVFCADNMIFGRKPRWRNLDLIMDELEQVIEVYDVNTFKFNDVNVIPTNRELAKEMFKSLARLDIKWRGQARADRVDREMLRRIKTAGCVELCFGIESGDQKVLDTLKKGVRVERLKQGLRMCNEEGIRTRLFFITGCPGEDKDIVEKNIGFIEDVEPYGVNIYTFTPYPGTEVFHYPERFGMTAIVKDWSKYLQIVGLGEEEKPFIFRYKDGLREEELIDNRKRLLDYVDRGGLNVW